MSQQIEVKQLRALLERSEREKRELMEKLSRAQSHSSSRVWSLDASHNSYRTSASLHPPLLDNNAPAGTTRTPGVRTELRPPPNHLQQDQSRPMKRSKTTHAAGSSNAAPMMRSRSSSSRVGLNPTQFVTQGHNCIPTPAVHSSCSTAGAGGIGGPQQSQPNNATNTVTPDGTPLVSPLQYRDFGREMGVDEFLLMHEDDLFPTTSPITIPPSNLLSPRSAEPYSTSSFPSLCGSLTSGSTLDTAPMSRRNSSINDGASISGQFSEMVRIQSQQSTQGFRHSPDAAHTPFLGKRHSEGLTVHYAYPSSAPTYSALSQHHHSMEPSLSQSSMLSTSSAGVSPHDLSSPFLAQHLAMERSVSKDSVKSSSSLKLRAKEALARQNYAAKSRHLQPKPAAGTAAKQNNSAKDNGKAVIIKTKYERPKHPKVMCNQCNDHPEGFRGEHELRRHTEAKHKSMVKKWICRDPDLYGIAHAETAVKPLRDCKQCSQNKQYGAYYNAAAHLRRTHFKVKPRKGGVAAACSSRNRNGGGGPQAKVEIEENRERRGGKGGGDWPSMSELKLWMVEVTVPMDQPGALVPDGVESVGGVDPEDFEAEVLDPKYSSQGAGMPPLTMVPDGFDLAAAFAGVGGGFSQTIDHLTGSSSFQGELNSQLAEVYPLSDGSAFSAASTALQGLPISSAGFGDRTFDLGSQQSMALPPLMGFDGHHGYTSPVSSTATITQAAAGVYMDQIPPHAVMQAQRDELADLPFELTFTTTGQ
ncbi:hypothetical protein N657DRAFT_680633 [Parathielavia appendiculata]|uniref:DUF7896 domain-containing protein n=1 Tax=Parathielavia appendiculata TaxID=2587402 RepID=A0AAN6U1S6_9PEZI|nr:hypothetical protein N657DRAFT_680633 [Parathielavia appendiculata]